MLESNKCHGKKKKYQDNEVLECWGGLVSRILEQGSQGKLHQEIIKQGLEGSQGVREVDIWSKNYPG